MSHLWIRLVRGACAASLGVLLAAAPAQTFDSTSDGSDGALDYTGTPADTVIIFDPATHNPPLDTDGDNIYHFTSINIPAGVTVKLTAPKLNYAPVYWLAQDFVLIDGVLDVSAEPGHAGGATATRTVSLPGPGGFPGGVGGSSDSNATRGFGPGGADRFGYGGSYGARGSGGPVPYGNVFILPLIGGSGGGGNGSNGDIGAGGGAGGGALLIASSASIRVNGAIRADGGKGGGDPAGRHGGGGSGGAIRLLAPRVFGSGGISTSGGPQGPGQGGGLGRIRLEAFRFDSVPTLTGVARVVTLSPEAIFLPIHDVPSVRVSTVDGEAVPIGPGGSFLFPDVTINNGGQVVMNIMASNIPPGTQVKLHLYSQGGADQVWSSGPLTGTAAASVANASGTLPAGFTRCFVEATWTP